MAIATAYNTTGNREDLTDILTILEPEVTPLLSSFKKAKGSTNVYHEWQLDSLSPVSFTGIPDGQDVVAYENQVANRARVGNYNQIFRRTWSVSVLQEASDPAGVSNEVANSKSKAMRNIKRDIESALGSDNDRQSDTGTVGYKLRALGNWISSSGPSDVPAAYRTPSGSINSTATGSLTEAGFNDTLQSPYQAGGDKGNYTLYAGPNLKRAISKFQRQEGSTTAKSYMVTQDASEHRIDFTVDVYRGDFNTVKIIPTLFNGLLDGADPSTTTNQQKARGYLIDPELVGVSYMVGMTSKENPDLGGGRRGFILSALTLEVRNPKGLGKFNATS